MLLTVLILLKLFCGGRERFSGKMNGDHGGFGGGDIEGGEGIRSNDGGGGDIEAGWGGDLGGGRAGPIIWEASSKILK